MNFERTIDPNNTNNISDGSLYRIANQQNLIKDLTDANYDVVILDFKDGGCKIQANSMVLRRLINIIKYRTDNEIVLIGGSMGGLIAKYTLSYMEHYNENHNTRLNISIDTPHNRAYIPLCEQYLINKLYTACLSNDKLGEKFGTKAKELNYFLNCDAAKKMLIYHYGSTLNSFPGTGFNTPMFDIMSFQFNNDLMSLNDNGMPKKCRNLALACGSGEAKLQDGFNSEYPPFINLTQNSKDFRLYLYMSPISGINHNTILKLDLNAKITIGIFEFSFDIDELNGIDIYISNGIPLDFSPGGNYPFIKSVITELNNGLDLNIEHTGNECIVPTSSAFGLPCSSYLTDFTHEYSFDQNSLEIENYNNFIFDALYVEEANKEHITGDGSITPLMKTWIVNQIVNEDVLLQNKVISSATKRYVAFKDLKAGNNIATGQTGNVIIQNNSNILFTAGESVVLGSGFSVTLGSKFKAEVR